MTTNIAIMQPYLFPYVGYMNLVFASDIFVFYDDVTFIKQGWINRNRILLNNNVYTFSAPLVGLSSNKLIKDTFVYNIDKFRKKFLRQIEYAYKDSKNYAVGMEYITSVLCSDSENISEIAQKSVTHFFDLVGVKKVFMQSSNVFSDTKELAKADRIIAITKRSNSDQYINSIGGTSLYSKEDFLSQDVKLSFLQPILKQYQQLHAKNFVSGLSIIDLIMHLNIKDLHDHLGSFELS